MAEYWKIVWKYFWAEDSWDRRAHISAAVAIGLAIGIIWRCVFRKVNVNDRKKEAFFWLIAWTFGPPIWFWIESIFRPGAEIATASAIWAAVLATILVLVKP